MVLASQLTVSTTDESTSRFTFRNDKAVTDDEKTYITKAYAEGASYGDMGKELGRTRNSIAGIVSRLGLRHTPRLRVPVRAKNPNKVMVTLKPKLVIVPHPTPAPSQPLHRYRVRPICETAVTLLELTTCHCRWPLGDPLQPDFRFCGGKALSEKPYCLTHTKKARRISDFQS